MKQIGGDPANPAAPAKPAERKPGSAQHTKELVLQIRDHPDNNVCVECSALSMLFLVFFSFLFFSFLSGFLSNRLV